MNLTKYLKNKPFTMKNLVLTSMFTLASFSINAQIEIIAHRGASYDAPENTVASVRLAWEQGADAVETDIWLSKDNRILCIHDANTKRTTGADYLVNETESETLRTLDAGSFKDPQYKGEKIPFLEEILAEVPKGKGLVIEIKCGREVIPILKKTLVKSGRNKNISIIAFDFQTITEAKSAFSGIPCYWLCSNADLYKKNINLAVAAGLDGVSLNNKIITEEISHQLKKLNLQLYAWTVDDDEEAKRLVKLGVKGITTNRPGWLRQRIF